MPYAAAIGIGLQVGSSLLGKRSSDKAAKAAKAAAKMEAAQLEKRANQEEAQGGREAIEIRRQGLVIQSDAKAAMAASGGVTDDEGAVKTLSDIHGVVNYNALAALFTAKETAQQTRDAAKVVRAGGRSTASAYKAEGRATLLRGASAVYSMGKEANLWGN
jgi:hypothetical protein